VLDPSFAKPFERLLVDITEIDSNDFGIQCRAAGDYLEINGCIVLLSIHGVRFSQDRNKTFNATDAATQTAANSVIHMPALAISLIEK